MKDIIINLLKKGNLPKKVCLELTGSSFVGQTSQSDYWVLNALCKKLNLSDNDFYDVINECFNEFGLK